MIRQVAASLLAAATLLAVPTLAAAAQPTLTASVIPGQEIDLVGAGFPANADVALAIQRNGTDAGSQAITTNENGGFTATIDAGPGRGGNYTLTATSGSVSATVEALAVETAGGLQAAPPPTDTAGGPERPVPVGGASLQAMLALVGACAVTLTTAWLRRRGSAPASSQRPR